MWMAVTYISTGMSRSSTTFNVASSASDTSFNVFVDMHNDDASLSRLVNMLLGPVQTGVKPFVLRLKCLGSDQVTSSA